MKINEIRELTDNELHEREMAERENLTRINFALFAPRICRAGSRHLQKQTACERRLACKRGRFEQVLNRRSIAVVAHDFFDALGFGGALFGTHEGAPAFSV